MIILISDWLILSQISEMSVDLVPGLLTTHTLQIGANLTKSSNSQGNINHIKY